MSGRRLGLASTLGGFCLAAGLTAPGAVGGVAGTPVGLGPSGDPASGAGDPPGILFFSEGCFENCELYALSMVDGTADPLGPNGVERTSVGLAPSADDRVLFGSKSEGLLRIQADGSGFEEVGGTTMTGLAYDATADTLYGANYVMNAGTFFVVSQETGTPILNLPAPPDGADVQGLAFGDGGVYGLAANDTRLFFFDVGGNAWSVVGDTETAWPSVGLAFNQREGALYAKAIGDETLYRIDPDTAVPTAVGDTGVSGGGGLAWVDEFVDPCGNCPCAADINRDDVVDFADILGILADWGPCPSTPPGDGGLGLWGLSSTSPAKLYRLDAESGAATEVTELDGDADLCGLSFLDDLLYGSDLSGYPGSSGGFDTGRLDADAGTITFVSDQDESFNWHGLAANESEGVLYAVDLDAAGFPLTTLQPDGTVTTIGSGTEAQAIGLAFDDTLGELYAVTVGNELYRIDVTTGAGEPVGELGVVVFGQAGLAFDEVTRTLYLNAGPTRTLYAVDVDSGEATAIGANGNDAIGIDGLAWRGLDLCGSCPCPADITRDRIIDFADILRVLAQWGPCP